MRRSLVVSFAVAAILALPAVASALSRGTFDGGTPPRYPQVVSLGISLPPESGSGPNDVFPLCTGTLVSNTVVVTAAHCVAADLFGDPPDSYRVSFAARPSPVDDATWIHPVRSAYDPRFPSNSGAGNDVGIVQLPAGDSRIPTAAKAPRAKLPTLGLLDRLSAHGGLHGTSFELAGYGCNHFAATGGPRSIDCTAWQRDYATAPFKSLSQAWLVLQINGVATGEGGQCYGDSGGPQFLPGTRTIVSVTHGGDRWCRAENQNYRLDTRAARAFLGNYVTLP